MGSGASPFVRNHGFPHLDLGPCEDDGPTIDVPEAETETRGLNLAALEERVAERVERSPREEDEDLPTNVLPRLSLEELLGPTYAAPRSTPVPVVPSAPQVARPTPPPPPSSVSAVTLPPAPRPSAAPFVVAPPAAAVTGVTSAPPRRASFGVVALVTTLLLVASALFGAVVAFGVDSDQMGGLMRRIRTAYATSARLVDHAPGLTAERSVSDFSWQPSASKGTWSDEDDAPESVPEPSIATPPKAAAAVAPPSLAPAARRGAAPPRAKRSSAAPNAGSETPDSSGAEVDAMNAARKQLDDAL